MKTSLKNPTALALALALLVLTLPTTRAATNAPPTTPPTATPAPATVPAITLPPSTTASPPAAPAGTTNTSAAPITPPLLIAAPPTTAAAPTAPVAPAAPLPPGMLRMNFRNAPLELVLDYLSEAAGFTIVLETEVRGKVDVWNNQPVTKDEALTLLNIVLNKAGYAALQDGRILTIVARDEAKKRNIPVKSGSDPANIPKNDAIVTQIIPVRYISATQLTKDLQPLLPTQATLTANEAGNALVLTDSQANIHRMAEIIRALDTAVSSVASIRVFPMRFADAKSVAAVIKEVFSPDTAGRGGANADPRAAFLSRFRGGGGGGGGDTGGGGGGGGAGATGRSAAASRVVAVADERSNSLVVSAPEEMMATIEDLVKSVDTNIEDVMEIRVFRLKHADPNEMAEIVAGLFPDESRSNNNNNSGGGGRFSFFGGFGQTGGGGGGGRTGGGTTGAAGDSSERAKKQSRVLAVADARTASIIVSASRNLMKQVEDMVLQLDANPAKKQKVFVYSLENADVQEVETVLKALFESQSGRNSRSTSSSSQNNALSNRAGQNQSSGATGRGGSSGLGGGGSGGGAGGGRSPTGF